MYWPYIIVLLRKSSRLFCADILIYSKVGLFRDGKHGLSLYLIIKGEIGELGILESMVPDLKPCMADRGYGILGGTSLGAQ